ncbi:MAG TPA: ThiF family adenylyltransferase [Xanthobacteraceae bacterium]|jgi:proteasome lid subunit RPN8/RPN11|nr:ThiF family adenylyltransferase [Xanthobacteraceae bacterium]
MIEPTLGQRLALDQLTDIAARNGALEIMGEPCAGKAAETVVVRLSLATRHYRKIGGFAFRDRERVTITLHPDFPFTVPWLHFGHKRFIGAPHVQWGSYICLYQSAETEWAPADGLFGFFDRVDAWFEAAGAGQLDPDEAPLHPPVAYAKSSTTFVMHSNTPEIADVSPYWLGRADLKKIRDNRLDVIGWTHLNDWPEAQIDDPPVAAAILLKSPLPMEFPDKVKDLVDVLEKIGVEFGMLFRLWRLFALITPPGQPAYFVLGAPMRRRAAGEPLRQHLTVWEIQAEALDHLRAIIAGSVDEKEATRKLAEWMVTADARWCRVMENRPELVHRRDRDTFASVLSGKRIILFGCGALGSAVAETIARAGARAITLVDNGVVSPGLLARQRYRSIDIGLPKAQVLKERLVDIGTGCVANAQVSNLAEAALSRFTLGDWDLLIDATASTRVSHRIERDLVTQDLPIPLLTLSVSASASEGCVTVRMPGYSGGPQQVDRQAKLEAFASHAKDPLTRAFWPERDEVVPFQPEPGCSAPTFIGSAADIDFHAAALLNLGLGRLTSLNVSQASMDLIAAPWCERKRSSSPHLKFAFDAYPHFAEQRHAYNVCQSEIARRGIASEIRRIGRTRSDKVETGGLMFGEIDDSHRTIWIDSVSGPPPDSEASPEKFLCGTSGTRELADVKSKASGGSSRFIGIWHTHPVSRGRPSEDDLHAMLQLLHLQAFPPRQVLMLIVGYAATHPVFNYFLFRRDEFHLVTLDAPIEPTFAPETGLDREPGPEPEAHEQA